MFECIGITFTDLVVEHGGIGAGRVLRVTMAAPGKKQELHVTVSEPEPGRVIVESDPESGLTTAFTVEPVDEGRCSQVTIAAEATPSHGLQWWLERRVTPGLVWDELRLLEKYVQKKS